MKEKNKNKKILNIILLGIVNCFLVYFFDFQLSSLYGRSQVSFFDVGQGDSSLIINKYNQKILIDGGPDSSLLHKLALRIPFYDRYIDLVILSHPQSDHLQGLIDILKRYEVGSVILTGIDYEDGAYKQFLDVARQKNIDKIFTTSPKMVKLGSDGGVFKIIAPLNNMRGKSFYSNKEINNTSIVSQLYLEGFSFLFTGDAEKSLESNLVKNYKNYLSSDILKVAHHGSKSSSSKGFIHFVDPQYSVISVGKDNKYSHPNSKTIKKLSEISKILRTDLSGDIEFNLKYGKLNISYEKSRQKTE